MTTPLRPETLGSLTASGYRSTSVRDEVRRNLIAHLSNGKKIFTGVHGYDRTVIPALTNALLARHDILLLGLRGQAKTRLLRSLADFLDPEVPAVEGCEINDDPLAPACSRCLDLVKKLGTQTPIRWMGRDERYREKLATPDVTIADLIGDIDPIKAANLRKAFADPDVIHFGIIPRTNRGIFAINELPDLAPRIQVGLLNILEEQDLQIRGFPVRIPLDVLMVFSANPEDYTNRGNIITPLKDRISSQILTHYPTDTKISRVITDQEAWTKRSGQVTAVIPDLAAELVERVAFAARGSDLVDQSSGVSARMSIALREVVTSNLERRGLKTGEKTVFPRICDFWAALPAITGKIEMVYEGEQQGAELVAKRIIGSAVRGLFGENFPELEKEREKKKESGLDPDEADFAGRRLRRTPASEPEAQAPRKLPGPYDEIILHFASGKKIIVSDDQPFEEYEGALLEIPGLLALSRKQITGMGREECAFVMELILEGLHQNLRISREDLDSTITYSEALKFNLLRR